MVTGILSRLWPILEVLSVVFGIVSGIPLIYTWFSNFRKKGKREEGARGGVRGRILSVTVLVLSILLFVSGTVHRQLFANAEENAGSGSIQDAPLEGDFSVSATFWVVPIPLTDENLRINAHTSGEADRVEVSAASGGDSFGPYNMKTKDRVSWTFPANFYQEGIYEVTVRAYGCDGETASDSFTIRYPFQ